jgi:hypothetical protein
MDQPFAVTTKGRRMTASGAWQTARYRGPSGGMLICINDASGEVN